MRIKILIIGLLICRAGFSSDFSMKRILADKYYSHYDFYKAIPLYDELLKSHPDDSAVVAKLADIYDHLNDSRNSERYYAFLVRTKAPKPSYLLNYARALSRNGNYEQSALWYEKYREAMPEDPRGGAFSKAYRDMSVFYRDSSSFTIIKAPFSTTSDDFSPAYFGGSIVFTSDRPDFTAVRSTYNWTQTPYLDLYQAGKESAEAKPFSGELNSRYHEGPVTFNPTQDTIIFTRSNFAGSRLRMNAEGINKLCLSQGVWDAGQNKWTGITVLNMSNGEYSVEHPALSPDGRTLYFASDMPGGAGGFDLYLSRRMTGNDGTKSWGVPENLGTRINTRGNELFPFADGKGNLWFASNGLPGLGGLDIFMASKAGNGFSAPVNPGFPLNTRFDDFGLITPGQGEEGYLSSDRNNNYGNDDIYSFKRSYRKPVVVYDAKTGEHLASVRIEMTEDGAGTTPLTLEGSPGFHQAFIFQPFKSYELRAGKEGWQDGKLSLTKEQIPLTDTVRIAMVKEGPVISLRGLVYAAGDKRPLSGYRAEIKSGTGTAEQTIISDAQGLFRCTLQAGTDYRISLSAGQGTSTCFAEPVELTTRSVAKDTILDLRFPVYCQGDLIVMEDIYYDLDQYAIRPDAARVLDRLVNLMNNHSGMKIELHSHTDSRASSDYNMTLSENRAKSAAEYLQSRGIAADRVKSRGFGKTMLINKCAGGVPCSEAEHQQNRRTELRILSL